MLGKSADTSCKAFVLLLTGWLVSCGLAPVTRADARGCFTPRFSGLQKLSKKGVFVGEIHGTNEVQQLVLDVVCHGLSVGKPVIVGLEYPRDQQEFLDAYFKERDPAVAKSQLLRTRFWQTTLDGRASQGNFLLLEHLRRLKGQIKVVAYDVPRKFVDAPKVGIDSRDEASANYLDELRRRNNGNAYWVLLGGNVHARKSAGVPTLGPEYENYRPIGYMIRDWGLTHLNIEAQSGTAWVCGPPRGCQAQSLPVRSTPRSGAPNSVVMDASTYFDGVYVIESLTASPPAAEAVAVRGD